jgi:hypothetical protein
MAREASRRAERSESNAPGTPKSVLVAQAFAQALGTGDPYYQAEADKFLWVRSEMGVDWGKWPSLEAHMEACAKSSPGNSWEAIRQLLTPYEVRQLNRLLFEANDKFFPTSSEETE